MFLIVAPLIFTLLVLLAYVFFILVFVSLPVYLASKIIVPQRSEMLRAVAATFLISIAFIFLLFLFGPILAPLGFVVGFFIILLILSMIYHTGFLKTFGLSLIAFILVLIFLLILSLLRISIFIFSI
ncbi:MAG: hypothetical protein QW062_05675 [Thermoplasmatales archaeon]